MKLSSFLNGTVNLHTLVSLLQICQMLRSHIVAYTLKVNTINPLEAFEVWVLVATTWSR